MKFIKHIFLFSLILSSCKRQQTVGEYAQTYPPYKLILDTSEQIKKETGLILFGYGINNWLPKDYEYINGIGNFSVSYKLLTDSRSNEISLERSRDLITYISNKFIEEINKNKEVIPDLDIFPFPSDRLTIFVHFTDPKEIELGQGVAIIYLSEGRIEYEGYKIKEYTPQHYAIGEHFLIHEESLADAIEIVKNQRDPLYRE